MTDSQIPPNIAPDTVNGLHDQVGYWLGRLQAELHANFEHRLAGHGVTVAQWGVLIALYKGESATVRGLAAFLHVDGGAVTRLIDRLESKGLVSRRIDRTDRRSVVLTLSAAGKALVPTLAHAAAEQEALMLDGLGTAEQRRFLAALARLLAAQGIEATGQAFDEDGAPEVASKSPVAREPEEQKVEEDTLANNKDKKDKAKDDKKKDKNKKEKKDKKIKKDKKDKKEKKKGKKKKDKK